jgi:alpha-galactosidase
MDIDAERLDMIHKLGARYAKELGADLRFESTTDRRTSLQNADFVISTAAVKSHHHQRAIRDVIEKHGYYYRLGERTPGSFYQFELMLDTARDIEAICPEAWLIQSANPVFDGCTLMTRETGVKVCGLCHGHYGVYEIARTIGLDVDDMANLNWQAPGLNHNIWLTHFIYKGQDAYPLIDEWIETRGEEYWRTHLADRTHDIQMSRGAVHQYRMYGLFPIGDTVRRGGWWYHTDLATKKHWFGEPFGGPDTDIARPFFVENLEKRVAEMTRLANDPKASLVESLGATKTREQQVPIIDALVNDHEGYFQVNVPNNGALAGIPDDVVVELPALINKKGIQTLHVGALPPKVMLEHVMPEWLSMERGLHAFKTGDRSMLLWGILHVQQTQSYDQAMAALEDMLAMEGHEEMNDYFKYLAGEDLLTAKHAIR